MHTQSFSRRPSGARPSFRRGPSRRASPHRGERIDPRRFINKAVALAEAPVFVPKHFFKDFAVDEKVKANITAKGYITPTPIQDGVIPHILNGKDVVGIANTGTGKTAAFLIPLINKMILNRKEAVLVMVPTRELAIQIEEEFKAFAKGMQFHSVTCIGGANIGRQMRELRYFNNMVIGTPGRLKDLVDRKVLNLGIFNTVVLDESDRMLDMGFLATMRFMLALTPKNRQTLFFSATVSREVEGLIKEFLRDPVSVSVKTAETAENIEQDVVNVRGKDKLEVLFGLLREVGFDKVLIFGRTKHGVERLAHTLAGKGFKAESIHGNKNQIRRQKALTLFKQNHVQILVATDVAARGLDIDGVSHVINFDLPATHDDYVHRIGRTGRGGKKGKALTFVE